MASVTSLDKDLRRMRLEKYTPAAANEARAWIEDILGERLPGGDLLEGLKNGVALCKLVNLATGPPGVKFKQSAMPFVQMENISHFLRACQQPPLNLQTHDMFLTVDLFEQKDPAQVMQCLGAFSRAAQKANPAAFPTPIGGIPKPKPSIFAASVVSPTIISPQSTGSAPAGRARGMSNASSNSSSLQRPAPQPLVASKTGDSSSSRWSSNKSPTLHDRVGSPSVSSWSKKNHEGVTSPAWNIAQYGYMGGASQGNLGVAFGGRRQITSASPRVPTLADKERRRKEQEAEAESQRLQMEEETKARKAQLAVEEARAHAEEERRWEDEARRVRAEEKRKAEEEKRRWEEEERQWKLTEEKRRRDEEAAEAKLDEERRAARLRSKSNLQLQQQQNQPHHKKSDSDRIRELEEQLERARQRELEYEEERSRRGPRSDAKSRNRSRSKARAQSRPPSRQDSWSRNEREVLKTQWDRHREEQAAAPTLAPGPSLPPRPLPEPGPKPIMKQQRTGENASPPLRPPQAAAETRPLPVPGRLSYQKTGERAPGTPLSPGRPLPTPASPPSRALPNPASPPGRALPNLASPPGRTLPNPASPPTRGMPNPAAVMSSPNRSLPFATPPTSPPSNRTDRFLAKNAMPRSPPAQQTYSRELGATAEQDAEDRRRQQAQTQTKAGGWASKSLLEREMEMERQRQREWEEAQQETAKAVPRGEGVDGIGGGLGGRWDVGQWSGFTGGDSQNKGTAGIGAGRRPIVGPRPLPNRP